MMLDKTFWFIVNNPYRIVIALLIVVSVPALGIRNLSFSLDESDFYGGNDKHVTTFEQQEGTYSKVDNVLLVIEPIEGEVFTPEFLDVIERATAQSWKIPFVTRVDSITNFSNVHSKNDVLVVKDLISGALHYTPDQLEKAEHEALTEPLLVNRLVSSDSKLTALNITMNFPIENVSGNLSKAVDAIRALTAHLEESPGVAKVYLTGTIMINNAFLEITKHDMVTLIPIMFLMIIVLLTVLLRSFGGTFVTFIVVAMANAVALGSAGYMGIALTPPSAGAAPIIMTLSIAACVHMILSYFRALGEGKGKAESSSDTLILKKNAAVSSMRSNFMPVTLTSITTGIGFLTMNFSDSPPFHHLGNLVTIGVVAAYILTIVLLPAILVLLPYPRNKLYGVASQLFSEKQITALFSTFVIKRRRSIMIVTLLISILILIQIPRNELNDEFLKYFDTSVEFRQDNDFITENLTGVYLIDYSLASGSEFGIHDPEYLKKLDAFSAWFKRQPEVWNVQSITDIYKKSYMNLNKGDRNYYKIPESKSLAAQSLFAYEMSLPIGLDINDRVSVDKSETKFSVSVKTISAKELIDLERRAEIWLEEHAPDLMAIGTGPAMIFAHIGMGSIKAGLLGGFTALALISVILMIVFRSVKIGIICLIPNLLPAALGFGVWALVYAKINMALATVISMTMGIVVDDTIHFVGRYLQARREKRFSPDKAVEYAIGHVGMALIITTLVLIAGFLVLTFSPFIMNWGMGWLTAIIIGFALITDLLLLPPILMLLEDKKNDSVSNTART